MSRRALSFSIHACIEQNPLRSGSPFECVLSPATFKSMCTASAQNRGFEEEKRPKKFLKSAICVI